MHTGSAFQNNTPRQHRRPFHCRSNSNYSTPFRAVLVLARWVSLSGDDKSARKRSPLARRPPAHQRHSGKEQLVVQVMVLLRMQ
ncbi:hypothetical protein JZ751_007893 [Albula glossodonta]|uniref:Uncharacterized protein n=1 Tax=Albula glossodonta TaxID=121402 RepID=A0A8T2P0E8_9TELE|nr:hypothetical protein JZ751_007893 [Albula glossodonta]